MSLMKEEPWVEGSGDTTPEIKSFNGGDSLDQFSSTSSNQSTNTTTSTNNSVAGGLRGYGRHYQQHFEYLVGKSAIAPESSDRMHVPHFTGIKKVLAIAFFLGLPAICYVMAGLVEEGALILPLSAYLVPSYVLGAPLIYFSYKYKGKMAYTRRTGPALLVMFAFIYYTLFQPLILLYFIQPFYGKKMVKTNVRGGAGSTIEREVKDYSDGHWIITLPLLYLHFCVLIQLCLLSQCKLRTRFYRYFISYPASAYFTATLVFVPFLLILPFLPAIVSTVLSVVPLAIGFYGLRATLITRPANKWEVKEICLRTSEEEEEQLITKRVVQRIPCKSPRDHEIVDFKQPLSIVQITDPHLGPIMSVERLNEICENTVKLNPDLVFLTGDFFTVESFYPIDSFERAIAPLKKLQGRVFAILGNHDYEEGCREILDRGLATINCPLLVDQSVLVDTRIGKVQIIGFDYRAKARQEHIEQVCNAYPPPQPGIPRIGLLHDPGCFKFIPLDSQMLVLSGHTHGGLIGLHSLGIKTSLVHLVGVPDFGLFKNSTNYLYVHAGQGIRNLMGAMLLRVGTVSEDSLYQVYFENNNLRS